MEEKYSEFEWEPSRVCPSNRPDERAGREQRGSYNASGEVKGFTYR